MISLDRAARRASGVVLGLMLLCGGAGIAATLTLSNALTRQQESASLLRSHLEADMMHDAVRSDVLAALAATDPASGIKRDEVVADLNEHLDSFAKSIAEEHAFDGSADISAITEKLAPPLTAYGESARRIVGLAERDRAAALAALPDFFRSFRALETAMESASEAIEAHVASVGDASRRNGLIAMVLLALSLMLGVGVALRLSRLARGHLVGPLLALTDTMQRLGDGARDVSVPPATGVAELGDLTDAIGRFQQQLAAADAARDDQTRLIVDSIGSGLNALSNGDLTHRIDADLTGPFARLKTDFNDTLAKLRALIGRVIDSSQAIRDGSGEIAQASDDLARRTESNAASLEQTSAAVAQMNERLRGIAEAATRTVERADGTIAVVSTGRSIAQEATQAMNRVADSAKGIDDVIEGLDKIAFQTRVLAMNAAVEAGRAGEAGRGFMVVADLVSALAMRAEDERGRAREQLTVTRTDIGAAVEAVTRVDGALVDISGNVSAVHELLGQMADDNQAQSTAITQISSVISAMDHSTQQNAAMVEQASAAARSLTQEASALAAQSAQFRIGGETRAPVPAPAPHPVREAAAKPARVAPAPARVQEKPARPAPPQPMAAAGGDDWDSF